MLLSIFLTLGFLFPAFTSTPPGDTPIGVPLGALLHLNAWGLEGGGGLSLPASVPGDIVSDLQSAGLIPDPYYQNNTRAVSPLWDELFTYSTRFNLPTLPPWESAYSAGSLYLVLEGAKMVADVFMNGVPLGDMRSQFVRRIIPLPRSSVAPTNNLLQVAFPPSSDPRNTEGRFMASSGGWDWAPGTTTATLPTAAAPQGLPTFTKGLWRTAYLFALPSNTAAITHLVLSTLLTASNTSYAPAQYPREKLEDGSNGPWRVRATVHFLCAEETQGTLALQGSWSQGLPSLSQPLTLPPGNSTIEVFLSATNVNLWWPAGLGGKGLGQTLYTVSATFSPLASPLEGRVSTSRAMGFRTFYLVTANEGGAGEAAAAGEGAGRRRLGGSGTLTLRYKCNGLDLWVRGANLVPLDDMEGRLSTEGLRGLVLSAVQGGMNALRVWGGGVYQPDAFYDAADQAGLLLLHDLAYANEKFLPSNTTTQADEIAHSVRRLAHHPSVVAFQACNECEPIASPGQELVTTFALPAVAAEVDDRPLWPASPSAGWASGVDRLTGLPNGKEPLIPLRRGPSRSASGDDGVQALKQQHGAAAAGGALITPPGSPPLLLPPSCGPNCTYLPFATTPYKAGGDATLRNVSSPTQCMAACLALPPSTCVCALWDGVLCFLRGTGLLDRFWASDALWPDRSGPLPTIPADFHGPYYSPGGVVRTVSSPSGVSSNWSSGFPLLLPPPSPLGVNLPGVFNSEFGVTSPPSFENIAPSLPPDQWGLTGPALYWRNYACDGAFATYFPGVIAANPNFTGGVGPFPFQAQLYLCSVAHTLKLASLLEPTRAQNYMGSLIWQLNEVWDTVGWGSLEYGGGQRGSVVGGRWKILHYALARTLFSNVFATCGANGACFVRNDHPLEGLAGGELEVVLVDTMTGKPSGGGGAQLTLPLTLPTGPAQIAWGCLTGGDPASPTGCAPLAPFLASQACANGLSCVAQCTVRDGQGAVVASNTAFFAPPGTLHLPSDDFVRLSVAVADGPNGDGSINVTVASASTALFVHLTSAAQGRWSDSGFHMLGGGLRELVFLPLTPQEYNTLVDTIRVEHVRTYF